MKENDGEEKKPINIELTDQKTDPYNDENSIESKWSDLTEEDEEDIALANFIESLKKKQTDEKLFFQKSNYMIAVSYIMKIKLRNFFFEVISNSKSFNIIFFNEMVNDQDFPKLTGGTRQRGGGIGQRRIRYY